MSWDKSFQFTDGIASAPNGDVFLTDVMIAGTYRSVTVDANGRVISGSNPTTLAGYFISDAYTKSEVQTSLPVIGFATANSTAPGFGQVAWDTEDRTLEVGLDSGVVLQLGQETLVLVRNGTGATIPNGTVVMYNGTLGSSGRLVVAPMDASDLNNTRKCVGIATEDIPAGADGFATNHGKVRGLNTSAFNEGDLLYVSTIVHGGLTNIKPDAGSMAQPICLVVTKHATVGTVMVRVVPINYNQWESANPNIQTHIATTGNPHGLVATDIISGVFNSARLGTGTPSASTFLRGDGAWVTLTTGTGDVLGAASSTDNAVVRFDLTTGKLIQNSGVIIDDSNNMSGLGTVTATTFSGALNGNATTATNATSHISNATGAHTASAIAFTATDDISATNVQSAVAEVASTAKNTCEALIGALQLPTPSLPADVGKAMSVKSGGGWELKNFAPSGYGLGEASSPHAPGNDLNSVTTTGFYRVEDYEANRPADYANLIVFGNSTEVSQICIAILTGAVYSRKYRSPVGWSAWKRLTTSDEVLLLSGGTMTGNITIPNGYNVGSKTTGGAEVSLVYIDAGNNAYLGSTAVPATILSSINPAWYNGTTTKTLATTDQLASVPSGAVSHFAMSSPPSGWLKANGAAVSRTTYAGLFSAIGTTFGVGDGSTTFNLPDLRGVFMRGWDDGRGYDSGRVFGSYQADDNKAHSHSGGTAAGATTVHSADEHTAVGTLTGSSGGSEARPKNVALLACIKY